VCRTGGWSIQWIGIHSRVVSTLFWFVARKLDDRPVGTWRYCGFWVWSLGNSGLSTIAGRCGVYLVFGTQVGKSWHEFCFDYRLGCVVTSNKMFWSFDISVTCTTKSIFYCWWVISGRYSGRNPLMYHFENSDLVKKCKFLHGICNGAPFNLLEQWRRPLNFFV